MKLVILFALNVGLGAWLLAWTTEKVGKCKLENKWLSVCFYLIVAKFFGAIMGTIYDISVLSGVRRTAAPGETAEEQFAACIESLNELARMWDC